MWSLRWRNWPNSAARMRMSLHRWRRRIPWQRLLKQPFPAGSGGRRRRSAGLTGGTAAAAPERKNLNMKHWSTGSGMRIGTTVPITTGGGATGPKERAVSPLRRRNNLGRTAQTRQGFALGLLSSPSKAVILEKTAFLLCSILSQKSSILC